MRTSTDFLQSIDMKRLFSIPAAVVITLIAVLSCSKQETEDLPSASKSVVVGQCSTSSFTASITGRFVEVSKADLALGKRGLFYCLKTADAENLFNSWLEGNDNPGCMVLDRVTVESETMYCTVYSCNIEDDDMVRARISDLESDRDYYCRLYVKYPVSSGQSAYVYGPEKAFRTKDFRQMAVDLGLPSGLLWATCNVGAEKPEDYGDYYAWGETDTYYEPGYAQVKEE